MTKNEIITKIEALNEWEELLEEAKSEVESLRDSIKAEMMERDTEELAAGQYIVRWTSVLTNRFDTTNFKKAHSDLKRAPKAARRDGKVFGEQRLSSREKDDIPRFRGITGLFLSSTGI